MFHPARAAENIKEEFVDYISTTYSFANPALQAQFVKELDDTVAKGPLLELQDVFRAGASMEDLIREGVLSPLFRNLEARKPNTNLYKKKLPLNRPLYLHQEQAIRKIAAGKNAVISTGTGSGKTNCFLIPVLNALLREQEAGTLGTGVRALFIYPMNALANDQMKNIRSILMYYPDITFGVYNGGTEYQEEDAVAVYQAMFATEKVPELRNRLPNEMLSRDEMKRTPPNILFTNYAMLEHLLLRPNDDVLFTHADFKFVVLDEAHVYTGATGIETALLLRRLRARITVKDKTQFILTSATLGSDDRSDGDILTFAQNLCGVHFEKSDIIRSTREQHVHQENKKDYPAELYRELAEEENIVWKVLQKYHIPADSSAPEAELLYDFLKSSSLYDQMRCKISRICSLQDLEKLLELDSDTAIAFISLCTRAQKDGKALLDARYHFFIRSLEGCYTTCASKPQLFLTRKNILHEGKQVYKVFETAVCSDCGRIAFVGKIKDRKLEQAGKLEEKVDYFYPITDFNSEIDDEDEESPKQEVYYLCPQCGAIVEEERSQNLPCDCGKQQYIKVVKAKTLQNGGRCGNCHTGKYRRLYLGNDAATAVLATSLYEELPEVEYVEEEQAAKPKNIFARAAASTKKPARKAGRQFLTFSDSRQEAAKFACYLSKSYHEFLRRRGICKLIEERRSEIIEQEYTISDFVTRLTNYFSTKGAFAKSNNDNSNQKVNSNKNAWVAMLNELARFSSPTSLTSLGQLQFHYRGNTPELVDGIAESYNVSSEIVRNLLDLLIFEIVKAGAICPNSDSDIDDDDREYIFYSPNQRFITAMQEPDKKSSTVTNWYPKNKNEKKDEYYKNNRMYYVCKALKLSQQDAFEFLKQYFEYLTEPINGNPYCLHDPNKNGTYVLPAEDFQVLVHGDPKAHWYRCKKCGRVTQFHIDHRCTSIRCEGELEEVDPEDLVRSNHFAKLYFSDRMSPLFIKEHTAQLSKKESAEYQEQFIKKDINALSCSTTFEMGVDVGDLETVFLRDVPPLPSNYAQRAGRAGRSVNAAAFVLTFAKLSSHDLSFFQDPKQMIGGVIMPPLFKVDNEKIVRRHIYAVALSMFFADHEELYGHNNAEQFINQKGYRVFLDWINSHPARLQEMLKRSIPDIDGLHERIGIHDFSWIEGFSGKEGVFTQLIEEYENNVANFEKQVQTWIPKSLEKANSCKKKLEIYQSNKLIDFLARGNILPRYGFPVDTVELYQNTTASNISKLRLSRDLQVAIAEYAPSSEVVADGRLYTSRYIKKSALGTNQQDWHTAYIGKCPNEKCGAINYSITPIPADGVRCTACGEKMSFIDFRESIEPRSGFVAERKDKDVPMTRQEKNYRSEDFYIGNKARKVIDFRKFRFNGNQITVESTTNDSLLVKSASNFYVCPICGYSVAEDESIMDSKVEKQMRSNAIEVTTSKSHESLFGTYLCSSKRLVRRSLHHVFNTDVAKLTFDCDTSDYKMMVSVMYALLNAISKYLNIERRDIKACLSQKISQGIVSHSIIIYDSVPGGAGHSRRLVTDDGKMLYRIFEEALKAMNRCQCEPSCYNCLRSYENQKIHDILDRHLAIQFLEPFIGEIEVVADETQK